MSCVHVSCGIHFQLSMVSAHQTGRGYYDEMTNTFEEINEKRDIVEKDRPGLAFPRTGTPGLVNGDSPKAQRTSDDVLKVLRRGEGLIGA